MLSASAVEVHRSYLSNIVDNFRNDLIQGNFRTFRLYMNKLKEEGVFSAYQVVQNGVVTEGDARSDSTPGGLSDIAFELPIFFESSGETWGQVRIYVSPGSIFSSFNKVYEETALNFALAFLGLFLFAVLWIRFLAYLYSSLRVEINALFLGTRAPSKSKLLNFFWGPLLRQLSLVKADLDQMQKERAELAEEAAIGSLARQVAHDIRSPLTALNIALSENNAPENERRALIAGATRRIGDISNNLLLYSRKKNEMQRSGEKESILRTIEGLVLEARALFPSTQIILSSQGDGSLDRSHLRDFERAISNLLVNACEAVEGIAQPGVKVHFASDVDRNTIHLSDNGPGMDFTLVQKLGFQKGAVISRKKNGNGLGVYYSVKFFRSLGGDVEYVSELGRGTSVRVTLPVAP
ncbi:MAG: HAMP domain-containing histidine kinase [Bdellovibrionaceae bacterium]|nr:HAMP domain-containing histidine kinase [Pseudobdellovibrionaceae bacterium]